MSHNFIKWQVKNATKYNKWENKFSEMSFYTQ